MNLIYCFVIFLSYRKEYRLTHITDIQSQLHQTKRRFTDFVFQRVRFDGDEGHGPSDAVTPPTSAAKQNVRSPRSVSSSAFTSFPPSARATAGGGVPVVRATSPGAEFREERQRAAARREAEERKRRALESAQHSRKASGSLSGRPSPKSKGRATPVSSRSGSLTFPASLRRFQISQSPASSSSVLKAAGGGVQKKKGGVPARAVLVEKLTRSPSVKADSALEEMAREYEDASVDTGPPAEPGKDGQEPPGRPRKRPVINEAEKRWRESQKAAIAAAKANITSKYDGADDMDRLAKELEQVVLDLEQNDQEMRAAEPIPPTSPSTARPVFPKPPPLKYQPKPPKSRSRTLSPEAKTGGDVQDTMQVEPEPAPPVPATAKDETDDDSDGDYVYDTYIRRPLPAGSMLTNPLLDLEAADDALLRQSGIDLTRKDIGVVVITEEDEYLWDNFAEDEEEEENWDGEDVDSNGKSAPQYFRCNFFFEPWKKK